ncbi:MAG: hypothetical protein KDA44_23390 [Planctomycetales bacterium]|nr:hypothetical protein [Planctomycetales bacterium]
MRFGLPDLLIAVAATLPGFLAGAWGAARIAGEPSRPLQLVCSCGLGLVGYLVLTSPLYRWLKWRPLLFPRCPQCRHKDRCYYAPREQPAWPVGQIPCANCGKEIELWYDQPGEATDTSDAVRFQLLWPRSFGGRWRRLD